MLQGTEEIKNAKEERDQERQAVVVQAAGLERVTGRCSFGRMDMLWS